MVAIAPFRAIRYNLDLISDLSTVVAPPYDVISPEEQNRLYDASPYNVVRLIYGKQFPADTQSDNCYTRAKQAFDHWCNTRVLVRDETPAIYLYEHTFLWPAPHQWPESRKAAGSLDRRFESAHAGSEGQQIGAGQGTPRRRLGFVALLEFEGSVPDQVFCHEATFEEPKTDRTRLLDAVRANLSPIFCLYRDASGAIHAFLSQLSQTRMPLATVHLGGEEVRIWSITEPDLIRQLQHAITPASVLIADGHHRFEAALSRRHLCQAVMSYFSWLEDPAVMALPIHRVVRVTQEAKAAWLSRLTSLCTLIPLASLEDLIQWLVTTEGHGQFGYYEAGRCSQARLHQNVLARWLMQPSVPLALAGLDITILHEVLIPQLLGPSPSTNHLFRYTPEPSQAIAMVDTHVGDCAWLLRVVPLAQVFALASQGLMLPQKSTYFYPKVLSGVFINPFD